MSQTTDTMTNQQWGGRFSEPTDAFVARFTASVDFDQRMYRQDIQGSVAHAKMLCHVGVLSTQEKDDILRGLEEIRIEIERGSFTWSVALEDVHMNIEAALTAKIGMAGKKLHTGRSRNDQVATDIRLYLRDEIDLILSEISRLQMGFINQAKTENATIMPGFTHLQTAQPVTFGHHILAWNEMLQRDYERLQDLRKRVNISPLGAAALAGTSYPIDRHMTSELLGFDRPSENSLDAVSDRDFAIEFCAAASLILMHLSRASEELILWTSIQFDFIDLPDRFCTGSSIMPQKKNPDPAELIRGRVGINYGKLNSMLTIMKGLPMSYFKDLQDDKALVFEGYDTLKDTLIMSAELIDAVKPMKDNMFRMSNRGFTTATDFADYLVKEKNLSFRDSYSFAAKLVNLAEKNNKTLDELSLVEVRKIYKDLDKGVLKVFDVRNSMNSKTSYGGTASNNTKMMIKKYKKELK